jgi:uncharacterized membrane protein
MKFLMVLVLTSFISTSALAIGCHGTEPFWSAEVSSDKIVLTFVGESQSTFPVVSTQGAWGYTADFLKVYTNDNGPVAVMTSNKCSDSMSDFEYPNEIIIFTGGGTLYGCCGEGVATGEGI